MSGLSVVLNQSIIVLSSLASRSLPMFTLASASMSLASLASASKCIPRCSTSHATISKDHRHRPTHIMWIIHFLSVTNASYRFSKPKLSPVPVITRSICDCRQVHSSDLYAIGIILFTAAIFGAALSQPTLHNRFQVCILCTALVLRWCLYYSLDTTVVHLIASPPCAYTCLSPCICALEPRVCLPQTPPSTLTQSIWLRRTISSESPLSS